MKKHKILNVDDNEQGRYLVSRQLASAGFEVLNATSGEEAMELMAEKPDVVVLDVNLPGISGLEVCRRIKTDPKFQHTIVIHMSATTIASKDKAAGLEGGADAYLAEPVEARELVATVKAMIRIYEAEAKARQLSRALEKEVRELEQQKQIRERFVNALSHDLRGPLSSVKMYAQLIRRDKTINSNTENLVDRIARNVERLDSMIEDLLDASRINAGESLPLRPSHCELGELLVRVVTELNQVHGHRLIFTAERDVAGVFDAGAIRRIVENLCTNAIKYGDPKSEIKVALGQVGPNVFIAVHNFGPVIPPGEQSQIFDQFHRARSSVTAGKEGWGIGLALVKAITEAHEGQILVESTREAGTTFTILLPKGGIAPTVELPPVEL